MDGFAVAFYLTLAFLQQISCQYFNKYNWPKPWRIEIEKNKITILNAVQPGLEGYELDSGARLLCNADELFHLRSHNSWSAYWTEQHCLIQQSKVMRRLLLFKQLLAA
jgi:hypothetical protein